MLEEGSFRGRTADFFFMFLFGGTLMTISFIICIKFTSTGTNQNNPDFKPRGVGDFSLETGSKTRSASIPTKNYKEKLKYIL